MRLTRLVEEADAHANNLKSLLSEFADEFAKLEAENVDLNKQNRALRLAFDRLVAERERDRERVLLWQDQLAQAHIRPEEPTDDVRTQDVPDIGLHAVEDEVEGEVEEHVPSSPPSLPSQWERALPLSIAAEEIVEHSDATQDIRSHRRYTPTSQESQEVLSSPLQKEFSQKEFAQRELAQQEHSSDAKLPSSLMEREWQPQDFVANPKFSAEQMNKQNTPAGFWDLDFPTSSQIEIRKTDARTQAKSEGRRRLKEALTGGRYVFKDKKLRHTLKKMA